MEFVSSVKMDILFIRIDVFRIAHLDSMLIITIHVIVQSLHNQWGMARTDKYLKSKVQGHLKYR